MYIDNAIYKAVPTASLSFPIAEGSVVTAGGVTGIVTENLAQASPTAAIYVAVGGTIDLTSPANKGVTFTDEQIKALGSDFNFIPAQEGTGGLPEVTSDDNGDVLAVVGGKWAKAPAPSSLPPYTSADKGKTLTLGEGGGSETVVIVPEQTVTFVDEPVAVSDAVLSGFVGGYTGILTVNDTDYEVEAVYAPSGVFYGDSGENYIVGVLQDSVMFAAMEPGTYTISLTANIPNVAPIWNANRNRNMTVVIDAGLTNVTYRTVKTALASNSLVLVTAYANNTLYGFGVLMGYIDGDNSVHGIIVNLSETPSAIEILKLTAESEDGTLGMA